MPLQLKSDHLQAMQRHADRAYPNECCGLLLGLQVMGDKRVTEVRSLENTWNEAIATELEADPTLTQTRRYWIAPEQMLTAMRDARNRNLAILGIYHSHPDHPAVPSECDRGLAWPQYSYLILSVQQGKIGEFYSWHLDENHQFCSEAIFLLHS